MGQYWKSIDIPQVPTEPPHDSLDDLEAAIRTHAADFHQARSPERSVFHRFALATLLIATPALMAAGILLHHFLIEPAVAARGRPPPQLWRPYGGPATHCCQRCQQELLHHDRGHNHPFRRGRYSSITNHPRQSPEVYVTRQRALDTTQNGRLLLNILLSIADMQQLIPRLTLLTAVSGHLREAPVVALLGARQVGKTTLARQVADMWPEHSRTLDLEVPAVREALTQTPTTLLRGSDGLVMVDEVQRLPALFEVLRPICDDPDRRAVFLLLGSASLDLVKGVSESLAGRILFVDVSGLSLFEVGVENQQRLWMRGGFPRAFLAPSSQEWVRWMQSFTQTFLERDIPGLGSRVSPAAIGRFWRMLAHDHGQVWNASELARSMDVSVTAVNRYRDLLAGTFMIRVLPPWFENLGKRLVKSPKVYLRDTGVLHFLLGMEDADDLPVHPRYGSSWEGFALEQTLVVHGAREAYFYATLRGAELDLLLLRRGKRWGFEFKCTDAPRTTKSMHIAIDDLGLEHLWVVYPGDLRYPLTNRITALPLVEVNETEFRPCPS